MKTTKSVNSAFESLTPIKFYQAVMFGADPEFFFSKKDSGSVVGSEKILKGKLCKLGNKFIIDGVQAELNPLPSNCRALFGNEISRCFRDLRNKILSVNPEIKVNFDPLVEVSQEEMDTLSESSKIFGCAPSTNIHYKGKNKISKIEVDPKKYLGRSAGGHIHLGNGYYEYGYGIWKDHYKKDGYLGYYHISRRTEKALKTPEIMVKMLDIIVGNTCVLLDRDPSNVERRKNYGRAGEHRIKTYGIEYRTLSNFWLKAYPLMSLVTGLARTAVLIVDQSNKNNDYVKAIFDAVNIKDVVKAINENDFDLAYANFKKIEPILLHITRGDFYHESFPIHHKTIKYFHYFVKRGVNFWFKEDPMNHWCSLSDGHGRGIESFLSGRVKNYIRDNKININSKIEKTKPKPAAKKRVCRVRQEVAA